MLNFMDKLLNTYRLDDGPWVNYVNENAEKYNSLQDLNKKKTRKKY